MLVKCQQWLKLSQDSTGSRRVSKLMSLEPIWDFFFLSIHHFCLKCRGMLDTSTIIVCKKRKQGHFVKKWKSYCIYTHLECLETLYFHSTTHPSVFNSHTAPYVHHKILMWGNNAGSVQTSQGSYYSSASTHSTIAAVVYKAYFLLSTIGQYECHQLPF